MPMQRDLYPPDWPAIALAHKEAASWTCQRCGAQRGQQIRNRHGDLVDVTITVAHLQHDPWNRNASLEVLCSRCHLLYDASQSAFKRRQMQRARGQLLLPGIEPWYLLSSEGDNSDKRKKAGRLARAWTRIWRKERRK